MARTRRQVLWALALISLTATLAGGVSVDAQARGTSSAGHKHKHKHGASCAKAHKLRSRRARRQQARRERRCERRRHDAHQRDHRGHRKHAPSSHGAAGSASGAGGCEGAYLAPSEQNLALVSAATLCLINRERAAHGETPLRANADLADAAQGHSESMAAQSYFEHVSPDGRTPLARVQASGYISGGQESYEVGENIAWASLQAATPAAIVAAWMASAPHRANILNDAFRDSGIGIAASLPASFGAGGAGAIYTQDFGAIL